MRKIERSYAIEDAPNLYHPLREEEYEKQMKVIERLIEEDSKEKEEEDKKRRLNEEEDVRMGQVQKNSWKKVRFNDKKVMFDEEPEVIILGEKE